MNDCRDRQDHIRSRLKHPITPWTALVGSPGYSVFLIREMRFALKRHEKQSETRTPSVQAFLPFLRPCFRIASHVLQQDSDYNADFYILCKRALPKSQDRTKMGRFIIHALPNNYFHPLHKSVLSLWLLTSWTSLRYCKRLTLAQQWFLALKRRKSYREKRQMERFQLAVHIQYCNSRSVDFVYWHRCHIVAYSSCLQRREEWKHQQLNCDVVDVE